MKPEVVLGNAQKEVFGLSDGTRRWTMCVPVDQERDSDMVLSKGLNVGVKAVALLREAYKTLDTNYGYFAERDLEEDSDLELLEQIEEFLGIDPEIS